MTNEQMQECMKNNFDNIQKYYFGTTIDHYRNPIGEIVTKMVSSKNL